MSTLIVVAYEDEFKAEEVRLALVKLQREHLVELEDAAVVVKNQQGKVKLKQAVDLTAVSALDGGFWGMLIGLLFFMPLAGFAVGATTGAISGALTDVGINDDFMRDLGNTLQPGTSALFILATQITPDKVLPELGKFGGTVLQTSLSNDVEAKLREALSASSAVT